MTPLRLSALILAAGLLASPQASPQPPRFRVAVDAVSIDAVVTDRDGHVVRDLTAEDFEIFQDGKRQQVAFAQFVPVATAAAAGAPQPPAKPGAPIVAPAQVSRERIQRTIGIVVDDLGLSFESLYYAKRALHAFVDSALQPGDLAAVIRTGSSAGALQAFTTDRRVLHSAIDRVGWNGFSRSGVTAFEAANDPDDFSSVDALRKSMSAAGTLGALNLAVQGTRDLPGRKALVLVTEGFSLMSAAPTDKGQPDSRARTALDRVIDQAARAGVVIYCLDARGLQTAGLTAEDNIKSGGSGVMAARESRLQQLLETQDAMAFLAEETGGFAVVNTNDLGKGLGRITNDLGDYYVIGYQPDAGTFKLNGRQPRLHKIKINVLRPGLRVRTRKEFLGISDPAQPKGGMTPAQQLVRAAVSPFSASAIALRATTLPGYSPERGMFVRTLLHIDARALTFKDGEGGRKTASADVVGMVFNGDGLETAHLSTAFEVALTSEAAEEALRDGLVYTLRVPIRSAGGYQLRFAIRDRASGALGSAGEFVDMPDIAAGRFALSGLVLRSDDTPASRVSVDSDQFVVTPEQALRVYRPGARLSYAYEIYNAGKDVRTVASLWRGTQQVSALPAATLVRPTAGERRFAAAGGLKLGDTLPPGSYVLQVSAATPDDKRAGRTRAAVQRMAFEVQ